MVDINNTALTDDQIMEIHDNLLDANPDLTKLASVNTRLISTQVSEIAILQASYDAILLSTNMADLGPTEIALENAQNAFYVTLSELFNPNDANEIYAETQNIEQEVHPVTGQEMQYTEIAGRTYFMPKETAPATTPDNVVAFQTPVAGMTAPTLAEDAPAALPKLTDSNIFAHASTLSPLHIPEPDTAPSIEASYPESPTSVVATSLSTDQLDAFWNAEANMRLASLEDGGIGLHTYTHVIADPRYVDNFDGYVDAHGLSGEEIDTLRTDVVSAHQDASATLNTIEFDGLQIQYYGSAQGFYEAIETENYDALGEEYTQAIDTNIFNGLGVTQPLPPEVLTEIHVPLEPPRIDSFPNIDTPVITVTPDPITHEPSLLSGIGSMFVSAAHAGTPDIDTTPYEAPAGEAEVANTNAEPTNLSFGNIETTNGGIAEFATSQNLSFGNIAEGSSLDSMMMNFDTATLGSSNIDAAPTSTPYEVQSGDTLTQIIEKHYGLNSNEAYRASLIVGAANSLEDANQITPGQSISLPSMGILQQAAGTDDLRLRNLSSHPDEIGSKVSDLMNNDVPAQGSAYAFPIGAAAAPSM